MIRTTRRKRIRKNPTEPAEEDSDAEGEEDEVDEPEAEEDLQEESDEDEDSIETVEEDGDDLEETEDSDTESEPEEKAQPEEEPEEEEALAKNLPMRMERRTIRGEPAGRGELDLGLPDPAETLRKVDALLAGESTAPPPSPKRRKLPSPNRAESPRWWPSRHDRDRQQIPFSGEKDPD